LKEEDRRGGAVVALSRGEEEELAARVLGDSRLPWEAEE